MTNAEYHADTAYSKSDLHLLKRTPLHFKYAMEHKAERTPTNAMIFGTQVHEFILEPEKFVNHYMEIPVMDRRTKEYKELIKECTEKGKEPIDSDTLQVLQAMRNSVMSNPYAKALLKGEKEVSYFFTDESTGINLKCRPDCRTDFKATSVIVDLKTCSNADTESFVRDCIKYGYDMQAALYKKGVEQHEGKPHKFVFIAVEKEAPYACNVLEADDLFVQKGRADLEEALNILSRCLTTDNWYGYNGESGEPEMLLLPTWIAKEYE